MPYKKTKETFHPVTITNGKITRNGDRETKNDSDDVNGRDATGRQLMKHFLTHSNIFWRHCTWHSKGQMPFVPICYRFSRRNQADKRYRAGTSALRPAEPTHASMAVEESDLSIDATIDSTQLESGPRGLSSASTLAELVAGKVLITCR